MARNKEIAAALRKHRAGGAGPADPPAVDPHVRVNRALRRALDAQDRLNDPLTYFDPKRRAAHRAQFDAAIAELRRAEQLINDEPHVAPRPRRRS